MSRNNLTASEFKRKVLGCWLGKAVGGTLGMPCEGKDGPLNYSFYDPVPATMLPNDDLDLQVLWACVLDKMETPVVDMQVLGDAWLNHVAFPWDEYGAGIRNLRNGIRPPLSGSYDNWFVHGMGAAIRSEIWGCLAPGNPALAAAYAFEDGCVDHAGEGIWAEVLFAAMEAVAFVESDLETIVASSLAYLPSESLVRRAVGDTMAWWRDLRDWDAVRLKILERYEHENFTDVT